MLTDLGCVGTKPTLIERALVQTQGPERPRQTDGTECDSPINSAGISMETLPPWTPQDVEVTVPGAGAVSHHGVAMRLLSDCNHAYHGRRD